MEPDGVVIGPDGALYWADSGSNRILPELELKERRIKRDRRQRDERPFRAMVARRRPRS